MVRIAGYTHSQGDIYFFSVQANPARPDTLLAFFPVTHAFHGCVAIATSTDGLRWSAVTPLFSCAVHGERTVHHPVAGLLRRGDYVHFYVHENVPGVTADVSPTPRMLQAHPYLRLPPTRIVRYRVPMHELAQWTNVSLRSIGRVSPPHSPTRRHPPPAPPPLRRDDAYASPPSYV